MLVPIACRFIPYDQWFVTHLDDSWKVRQVKHWILSKCNLLLSAGPHIRRPVSPITFAPSIRTRSSIDSLDDGYNEDDEFSDQDLSPHDTPTKPGVYPHTDGQSPSQPGGSPLVDRYTLISFSTGSMLEDEFTFSWYNLRPYELLEMHSIGTIAPLQRDVLAEYVQPYFQAKVRCLRVVWNQKTGRFEAPGVDKKSTGSPSEKRRKPKANWKTRWVVINQGVLSLCKEHVTNAPQHQFGLRSITALRGTDTLERAFSVAAQPRVVCIKFRPRAAAQTRVVSPPPSLPSSPVVEDLRTNVHEPLLHVDWSFDGKHKTEQEEGGEHENVYDANELHKGEGEWVILDMLNDHALSSILRILHREGSDGISSSFAPSSSIMAVSPQSPLERSFGSYETIPYPEWRMHTIENARKAGMGDVGKPMAWVIWTEKGLGESLMGNIRQHRQAFLQKMRYRTAIPPDIYGIHDESDDESEMEWEGWMRDLERQGEVKRRTGPSHGPSQLPSPPASEASPNTSPRVRSPSLIAHASERTRCTTISTVSVGRVPTSRRRSSTVSTEGKGKTRERFASLTGVRTANARAASTSPGKAGPVRHVHSSSNLRIGTSSEVADAVAGPSSPSKGQNGFMRGMPLGKLVKGLESAIDFVDEKS